MKHNEGVYRVVHEDCDHEEELIPTQRGSNTLYSSQPARNLEGRPSYYPLRGHLSIKNIPDGEKVIVDMIVAGEEFTDKEFFCIPPELQADVVAAAASDLGLMITTEEDIITDAKSN